MSSSHDSARSKSTSTNVPEAAPVEPETPSLRKGWTLGDSNALVDGRPQESLLTSLAWVLIPALIAVGIVYLFMPQS